MHLLAQLVELVAERKEREGEKKRIETFGNLIVTKREQESNGVACLVGAQRRRQVRLTLCYSLTMLQHSVTRVFVSERRFSVLEK